MKRNVGFETLTLCFVGESKMATSFRGRSSSRSGSTNRGYSFFGSNWGGSSPLATTSWGRSTGTTKRSTRAKRSYGTSAKTGATGYKNVSTEFQNKISSYRTLIDQTKGAAKFPRPTPATLNSFANWVNKGAIVQQVSPSQLARWAKTTTHSFNSRNPSTTSCKNVLCKKFGKTTIKAVTRSKNGWFLVATSPTHKGRAFSFPR